MKYSRSLGEIVVVEEPITGKFDGGEKENGEEGVRRVKRRVFGGSEGKADGCTKRMLDQSPRSCGRKINNLCSHCGPS